MFCMRKALIVSLFFIFLIGITGCDNTQTEEVAETMEIPIHENESSEENKAPVQQAESSNIKQASPQQNKTENKQKQSFISGKVTNVIDGDTIDVHLENGKDERIRFLLIDTPETKHPSKPVQPFGPEASKFTKLALLNKKVDLELDVQERDRYGRLLAYVYVNGSMINEILLEKGLARVAVFPPNTRYVDKFRDIQNKARQKQLGIWSIENYAKADGYYLGDIAENNKNKLNHSSVSFPPDRSGNCNGKIKGNQGVNGWIYHVPGGAYYQVTKAEACFKTEKAAQNAGYRKSAR